MLFNAICRICGNDASGIKGTGYGDAILCLTCHLSGAQLEENDDDNVTDCPYCKATGFYGNGDRCHSCKGTGKLSWMECDVCEGDGDWYTVNGVRICACEDCGGRGRFSKSYGVPRLPVKAKGDIKEFWVTP